VWCGNCPVGHIMLGETIKRLCKDAGIEGPFTNHSLRATTACTGGPQKGISDKFVMERTKLRDFRSLQKYQRSDTSSKIEISKKFDCCEAMSLRESVTSEKVSIKREVEVDKEEVKGCSRFLKGRNEAGTSATFNNCTFIVSKD
ncbi:unnamed protein product, partial [Porites evermanni]